MLDALASPGMGHSGTGARAPVDFHTFFGHFSFIRLYVVAYPVKKYGLLSLFIAQMDVSIKIFSLSFVPLLALAGCISIG